MVTKSHNRSLIYGRRPVKELFTSGFEIGEIYVLSTGRGSDFADLIQEAEKRKLVIKYVSRFELDRMSENGTHQGIAAYYLTPDTLTVDELISNNEQSGSKPLVVLDGVQDPHNFGAIIRSTEVLGGGGVIFRTRRAAGITPVVAKASAGAVLRLPLAQTVNIDQAIRLLKDSDYWVYGLDMDGGTTIWEADLTGKTAIVMGDEGHGLARLTKERCDIMVRIPQEGAIGSLNVSVSTGLALYEILRQNKQKQSKP